LGAAVKHDEQWQPLRLPDSGRQIQSVGQVAPAWEGEAAVVRFIVSTRQPLSAGPCISGALTLRAPKSSPDPVVESHIQWIWRLRQCSTVRANDYRLDRLRDQLVKRGFQRIGQ
jgi:hypothetical protein